MEFSQKQASLHCTELGLLTHFLELSTPIIGSLEKNYEYVKFHIRNSHSIIMDEDPCLNIFVILKSISVKCK